MNWLMDFTLALFDTLVDVLPIVAIIFGFQLLVIRRPIVNLRKTLIGIAYVLLGLTLFLQGLEQALFPIGRLMAGQLTNPEFIAPDFNAGVEWIDYYWVYVFAFLIGFSTTIAEPSLLAVAMKANQVSGGSISAMGLRIAVAIGVAVAH